MKLHFVDRGFDDCGVFVTTRDKNTQPRFKRRLERFDNAALIFKCDR